MVRIGSSSMGRSTHNTCTASRLVGGIRSHSQWYGFGFEGLGFGESTTASPPLVLAVTVVPLFWDYRAMILASELVTVWSRKSWELRWWQSE